MQQANFILFTSFGGMDQYLKQVCIVFLAIIWSIDDSCCSVLPVKHSYGGRFIGEEEAKALPFDSEVRLAKIPCNGTTKVNCIYAEHRNHHHNEIVVSWVTSNGIINMTTSVLAIYDNSSDDDYHKVHANKPKNVYIYNRIIELLAYMMLASAFEVCLLVLRNLRTIILVFHGFWSALNVRVQKLYYSRASNKGIRQSSRNLAVGEKRTISYIFAILTWRATQTANVSTTSSGANLREESSNSSVCYGHVTTMGDLLLLVLFTHVYYQRQKFQQLQKKAVDALDHRGINYKSNSNQQLLYDKQTKTTSNNRIHCSRMNCSQNCGNMYQQLRFCSNSKSSLLQNCFGEQKLAQVKAMKCYEPKIQYGTVFKICFLCHCSYRTCCYYFCYYCNCRRRNQRRYILYNSSICHCCCFFKSESCYDNNYCCCCCIYCWKIFWNIRFLCSHCNHQRFFRCVRLAMLNRSPSRVLNSFLLSKIQNNSGRAFRSLNAVIYLSTDYHILKLRHSNYCYSIVYLVDGGDPTIIYKHNYHKIIVHLFNIILSQYLLSIRNFQSVKWRKLQVAMVVMVMIFFVISASNGTNYNHHHYSYSSLFNKNFTRCKPHRRRHQHCKIHRSRHFFHSSLLQCIKHQKLKKKHKKCIQKKQQISTKQFSISAISYEHSLSSLNTSGKAPLILQSIKRERGSKPNVLWLLIGLIWFEGPKIVNCNIILNYQNQPPHEQQQQQHQQQQAGSSHKETTTNNVNSNLEYKTENFDQIKVKHNNNNNSNNNKRSNKNKHGNSNNNNNNNNNKRFTRSRINLSANMIPIFNTIHFKHYCKKNYHPKRIPASQRIQRALKSNPNFESSITSSASIRNNNIYEDLAIENIQSSYTNEEINVQSDHKRLESIKHQILSKLGLTRKPNVSQPLPKQFIWDTIYRADGIKSFNDFSNSDRPQQNHPFVSSAMLKGSNMMITKHKQQQVSVAPLENVENQIISFGNKYIARKINEKTKQIRFKYNNDVLDTTKSTKKSKNQLLNVTTNEDQLNHTTMPKINMSNNNNIALKQQHHQFHKIPQYTTHHEQNNNNNNNIIVRNQINNNYTNSNNNNNANNELQHNNNINTIVIMVQKHLRDINKKYSAEERKFTYLNDIKVSDDSLKSAQNHNSVHNNIVVSNQEDRRENLLDNTGKSTNAHANNVDADIDHHENYLSKLDFLEENDDFFGSTQEIITFAEKGKIYRNHRLVEFSHQNNEMPQQKITVQHAEIHIRIDRMSITNKSKAGSGIKRKRLTIWIFQLINYTNNGFNQEPQFCASFEVDTARMGWQKFDMTSTVREWYSRTETDKLRLLIDCTGCGKLYTLHIFNDKSNSKPFVHSSKKHILTNKFRNELNHNNFYNDTSNAENFQYNTYNQTVSYRLISITIPESNPKYVVDKTKNAKADEENAINSNRPFLVLHTKPRRQRRVRRRAINCNGALHGQCCKESFYVSFKALGWDDWIIAPRGYFANYCRGDCTGPYRTPDTFQTFHAHFIEEYRKMGLLNGMQPCCAPVKFSSMSLIYYGDEGIIKRDLPKMVVDECGCP